MFFKRIVDNRSSDSIATQLRRRRFATFLDFIRDLEKPVTILDVGGTEEFWEVMGFSVSDVHIILLNLTKSSTRKPNIVSIPGDARSMGQFANQQFDVVFSNSVIEHLQTFDDQRKMAEEVQRVGKRYFVQTPNFFFPIEPHFLFPFFHWLPRLIRIWLVMHFSLGWYKKSPDKLKATQCVDEIRLMTRKELQQLFPRAMIVRERFMGFTKSFMVLGKNAEVGAKG